MVDPAPDQKQRLQALDPRRSFIVQAPAGSGKTELLIQRFLVLLAQVDRPEAVVAITFTRKAAAEMRHRVIAAFQSASGPEPTTPHQQRMWRLAQTALAQNDRLNWRLTENRARLRIQTIDSLCAMLVKQMPWVSRMGAVLRPEEDARHLYRRAARRTLAMLDAVGTPIAVAEVLSRLLSHLDNNVGKVERLLSTMLGTRDQWLRHVEGNPAPTILREEVESALVHVVKRALEQPVAAFPEEFKATTVILARFAAENLRNEGRASAINACYEIEDFPEANLESLPVWLGFAEMLLTNKGFRRKALNKNLGFPPTEAGRAAKAQCRDIDLDPNVITLLHALRSLPATEFDDKQWAMLASLSVLLPAAVNQLQRVFQEERCVDFAEVALGARAALGSDVAPTDLTHTLDCPIRHVLVDEFQDTSQSQFDLLAGLIRDWRPGDGRTVFLVGDPMQSIYSFREAEVGLYLQARKTGIGAITLDPIKLVTNFRSSPVIVEWVNQTLCDAFPNSEDAFTGAVTYERSAPFRADLSAGAVLVHPFLAADYESESERVVELIDEAQSRRPRETVAVLVSARRHLAHIVPALRRSGKKFRAVEIDALGERPVVRDLTALTQALLHPGNRLAWLSILRAPWCGLTLPDLEALVSSDLNASLWDLLQDRASRERLSPDGRARIGRLIPLFSDAFAQRGRLPVRRCVESVWVALGGPACLETRTELEDASAYLDLLEKSLDGQEIRDEGKFADDIARLFASSDVEAGDDLQLMTIHKAKGLEFDTVILPGLGRYTSADERPLLLWREFADRDRARLLLAPIHEAGGREDPIYEYLRGIDRQRRDHESTRLLYVAATRARKHLHQLGHAKVNPNKSGPGPPNKRSLLAKIWSAAEPVFLDALKIHQETANEEQLVDTRPAGVLLRRLAADWTPLTPPDDIVWKAQTRPFEAEDLEARQPPFEWAGDLQRRVGIVVHRMLQQMRAPDLLNFSEHRLRSALRHEGLHGEALAEAVSRAATALNNTLADTRGRWILSCHDDDEREYALSTLVDGGFKRLVVDRTFVDNDTRWIIDYKTGTHSGGDPEAFLDNERNRYRDQLEKYARVIRFMDTRPIVLGLYFPMLRGWREWPFEGVTA